MDVHHPAHDSWTIEQKTWRENARYVNEKFWGIYLLMEMPNEVFAAERFGGKAEEYVTMKLGGEEEGVSYERLLRLVGSPKLKGEAAMRVVEQYVDVARFIDYFLVQSYAVNADWPRKNYRVVGRAEGAPGFRFLTWDSETAFFQKWINVRNPGGGDALAYNQFEDSEFVGDRRGPGFLFRAFIKMPEFRERFTKRARELLTKGGVLSPYEAARRYRVLLNEVEPLLIAESERWGAVADPEGSRYGPGAEKWKALTGEES